MTDLLLATCEGLAASKDVRPLLTEIYARYAAIAAPFQVAPELLAEIQSALQQFLTLSPNDDPHFHDKILASGEDNNARLIAGILQASGLAARYLNPEELGS